MPLTDRHKKPGGFQKLVNSLEITPSDRRMKILETMRKEDLEFASEVESHILRFEELSEVSDMVITDIVYKMKNEMRAVAVALYKCKDEALLIKFTKNMLPAQGAAFIEESKCLDKITVGEQKGAQFKIIEKARELQNEGIAMIKKYSSRYSSG